MKKALFIVQAGSSSYARFFLPLDRHQVEIASYSEISRERLEDFDVLMFSLTSFLQVRQFDAIHRAGLLEGHTVVVGGQLTLCLEDPESFCSHYGVDHLCIGHGARFIDSFCRQEPIARGVYREERPYHQAHLLLEEPELYRNANEIRLLFDFGCSWNKCLFCHHQYPDVDENMTVEAFESIKEQIIYDGRIRRLWFIDNEFAVPFLIERVLEDERLMSQLDYLYLFGLRCVPEVARLEPYLARYPHVLFDLRFGLEFVTQEMIKRFRKGYRFQRFVTESAYLFDNRHPNLRSNFYLMSGLPTMDRAYYHELSAFTRHYAGANYLLSFFLLDDGIRQAFSAFPEIEVGENIRLCDFNGLREAPPITTHYRHMRIGGVDQKTHFVEELAPTGLLSQPSIYLDDFMLPFFIPSKDRMMHARHLVASGAVEQATPVLEQLQEDFLQTGLRADLLAGSDLVRQLADLQFGGGRHEKALETYRQTEVCFPDDPLINLRMAACHAALGQLSTARAEYNKGVLKHLLVHPAQLTITRSEKGEILLTAVNLEGRVGLFRLGTLDLFLLHNTPRPIKRSALLQLIPAAVQLDFERSLAWMISAHLLVSTEEELVNLLLSEAQHQVDDLVQEQQKS